MEPIPAGKDFDPTIGDFGHKALEATPIVDYHDKREDSDQYLKTIHAQVADRQRMG